jgi:hypothetical protein
MLVYGVVIPCLPILVIDRLEGDSTMVGFLFGCYGNCTIDLGFFIKF